MTKFFVRFNSPPQPPSLLYKEKVNSPRESGKFYFRGLVNLPLWRFPNWKINFAIIQTMEEQVVPYRLFNNIEESFGKWSSIWWWLLFLKILESKSSDFRVTIHKLLLSRYSSSDKCFFYLLRISSETAPTSHYPSTNFHIRLWWAHIQYWLIWVIQLFLTCYSPAT